MPEISIPESFVVWTAPFLAVTRDKYESKALKGRPYYTPIRSVGFIIIILTS